MAETAQPKVEEQVRVYTGKHVNGESTSSFATDMRNKVFGHGYFVNDVYTQVCLPDPKMPDTPFKAKPYEGLVSPGTIVWIRPDQDLAIAEGRNNPHLLISDSKVVSKRAYEDALAKLNAASAQRASRFGEIEREYSKAVDALNAERRKKIEGLGRINLTDFL